MAFDWQGTGISASPDIAELLPNYKFTFVRTNTTSCFDADYVNGEYPCLKSSMRFERRYRNLLIGVYFPSLLFVFVAWASFFWPADAIPARTVLLITCLLTTISLYTSVQQITPPANYTRAIDIWFFACIVAVASALFEYAVILQ
ncbi:glutamate-gated chloride channel alpha-like [Penaeus japonicus]|uniref:glutamate-gated chloride channel alpha-like n=1 Tax=Penaeus japonicus TaxID=27405 RepID=UPI001C70F12D|nr:glutamate-gated chloride channel alpha-like [Penaeus japonicus]